jgi:hypothetical protein
MKDHFRFSYCDICDVYPDGTEEHSECGIYCQDCGLYKHDLNDRSMEEQLHCAKNKYGHILIRERPRSVRVAKKQVIEEWVDF